MENPDLIIMWGLNVVHEEGTTGEDKYKELFL